MLKVYFISTILLLLALFAGCENNNGGYYQGQYDYLNDPMYNPPLRAEPLYMPPDIPSPQIYLPPPPNMYIPPIPPVDIPTYIPPPVPHY